MATPILEFSHVTGTSRKLRLNDVNFELPAGYLMGLAGKNGAGKTTLLDYIVSPKKQYTGTIRLMGKDIWENHTGCMEHIGFVSEKNPFFKEYSAKYNANLLGMLYREFDPELFLNAMKKMELSVGKAVGEMSRGELMRFQTAFAMAHHARLYLLDEATAGLDPVFRIDYFRMLQEIITDEKTSVLMVTHLSEELERKMDYVGILEHGELISFGENQPE